ncbi:hypothetical protein ACLKA6_011182 [Drosophila palustris]
MNSRDRQFWTEFLLLYRSLPAVWKVKSPEYSSRALKSAGYEQLAIKLREVEPHADRALVVKKINSFRTNYRRDLRKRTEGGEGLGEEPFVSTLWYFELLGFLEGQESSGSCQGFHNASSPQQEAGSEAFLGKKRRAAIKAELPASPVAAPPPPVNVPASCSPRQRQQAISESEALAHTWRSQFDELAPRQKLLARKLISDVLYYACMDQLQPRHVSQLQQLMPPLSRSPSPQIEDVSSSPQIGKLHVLENLDDESDTLDDNG